MLNFQTFSILAIGAGHEDHVDDEERGDDYKLDFSPRTAKDHVGMDEEFDHCETLKDQGGLEGLERLGWTRWRRHDEMAR